MQTCCFTLSMYLRENITLPDVHLFLRPQDIPHREPKLYSLGCSQRGMSVLRHSSKWRLLSRVRKYWSEYSRRCTGKANWNAHCSMTRHGHLHWMFYSVMQWPAWTASSGKVNKWLYRVSQEECARLREGVPYVKVYRYNPKHLCPKLNGYGDNGQRKV